MREANGVPKRREMTDGANAGRRECQTARMPDGANARQRKCQTARMPDDANARRRQIERGPKGGEMDRDKSRVRLT